MAKRKSMRKGQKLSTQVVEIVDIDNDSTAVLREHPVLAEIRK